MGASVSLRLSSSTQNGIEPNISARAPLFLAYLFDKSRFEQHIRAALKAPDRYGSPALPKQIINVVAGLPDGEHWVQVVERAS